MKMTAISLKTQNDVLTIENDQIALAFDLKSGCFCINRQNLLYPRIVNALAAADYHIGKESGAVRSDHVGKFMVQQTPLQDMHGTGYQVFLKQNGANEGLSLSFVVNIYEDRSFLLLRLILHNTSGSTIHLDQLSLVKAENDSKGSVQFGETPEMLNFFKVGWHDWCYTGLRRADQKDISTRLKPFSGAMILNPTTPISSQRGDFWSEGWAMLANQNAAVVIGLVSMADQFGQVHARCTARSNELALVTQADGVPLDSGQTLESEWGYIQFVDLPHPDPANDYINATARQMKARVPVKTPPLKWTHWYHFFHNITEERFISNLEEIHKIQDELPFHTLQLDDGYQSAWGDWTTCNDKFSSGLPYLTKKINQKGYEAGLWLAPFVVDPRSQMAKDHPDWLIRDKKGKPIHSGFFYEFTGYALDATHPAVQEHLHTLMDTIAHQWGFKFVKIDFTYAGALPGKRYDPRLTRAQAFRKGLEIIRDGLGEDTFLLGCGCPSGPAIGIVDAMRIGPDTGPTWEPRLVNFGWLSPFIRNEKSVPCLRNNIRHSLNLSTLHRRWWWNDPDCLMVRNYDTSLTDAEIISSVSQVGLLGGLVVNSDDLTRLPAERRRLLSVLTPILSPGARPVDLFEHEMAEVYDLPMQQDWAGWHVTAVFNWADRPAAKSLDTGRLGFSESQPLHVFDFWSQTYQLHQGKNIDLGVIPAHGCKVLRICPADGGPALVGDTLHITQGGEIESWKVSADDLQFKVMDLNRKASGDIYLWLPEEPIEVLQDGASIPVKFCADRVYGLHLSLHGTAVISILYKR
jgi:alpha-galactosidase